MSNEEWIINLENTADEVAGICGYEVIRFILREHGARSLYDLNPMNAEDINVKERGWDSDLIRHPLIGVTCMEQKTAADRSLRIASSNPKAYTVRSRMEGSAPVCSLNATICSFV